MTPATYDAASCFLTTANWHAFGRLLLSKSAFLLSKICKLCAAASRSKQKDFERVKKIIIIFDFLLVFKVIFSINATRYIESFITKQIYC